MRSWALRRVEGSRLDDPAARRLQLEFFPYPDLDPATSLFGCCSRLDDLDAMVALVNAAEPRKAPAGRASKLRNWRRAA